MTTILVCLLVVLFFVSIFYVLLRKRYVRAAFKGPLASFSVEFEARNPNDSPEGDPRIRAERFDPHQFFCLIKLYAVEVAATIIFLSWLARAVWHELR